MKRLLALAIIFYSLNALAEDAAIPTMASPASSAVSAVADAPKTSPVQPYKATKYIAGPFAHSFNPVFKEPGKKVFIEFVGPKIKDTADEKLKQAFAELSKTVDMLSGEARKVLIKDGINIVENKADADVAFEIIAASINYGHDMMHPIIVPYLMIASTTDWDDLQHKMKLQKTAARPGLDAGALYAPILGPLVPLLSGAVRAVSDSHSDNLVEDTSPFHQTMFLLVEMYIKKNGEFKKEQADKPAVMLNKDSLSNYVYAKPDQFFADAVDCIVSCVK